MCGHMHMKVKRAGKAILTMIGSFYFPKELVITRYSCLAGRIATRKPFLSFFKVFLCDLE